MTFSRPCQFLDLAKSCGSHTLQPPLRGITIGKLGIEMDRMANAADITAYEWRANHTTTRVTHSERCRSQIASSNEKA